MLKELDRTAAEGRPYDTSSLVTITSAGVAWSSEVKQALLEYIPQVTLVDACGCSEGATIGTTQVRRGTTPSTDRFTAAPGLRIVRPDGTDIAEGDEELGMFLAPTVSQGYRNDPGRTAAVFRVADGTTYVLTGDWAGGTPTAPSPWSAAGPRPSTPVGRRSSRRRSRRSSARCRAWTTA